MESMEFPIMLAEESSANTSIFDSMDKGRSFVKMLKSLGPNKEPWVHQRLIPFSEKLFH